MKRRTILSALITLVAFSLFAQQRNEDKFWDWFTKNEKTYFVEIENLDVREKIFDDLQKELYKVNDGLAFEFSPVHDSGIRELTISAEGDREIFPVVEKLLSKAPLLKNWQFNAFRQRIPGDDFELSMGDLTIGYSDIFFRHTEQDNELGVELNIRNFKNDNQTLTAVYILLDALVGEYDVTINIDWIDWVKLDEDNIENLSPITYLREVVDRRKTE